MIKENSILSLDSRKMKKQKMAVVCMHRDKEDVWDIKREYWTGDEKTLQNFPLNLLKNY